MVATATLWTTSDALRAIEDVQTLMNDPDDAAGAAATWPRTGDPAGRGPRSALAEERRPTAHLDTHLPPGRPSGRSSAPAS